MLEPNYTAWWQEANLTKVAHDSAAAGIEPAISNRKFKALTTVPPSHSVKTNSEMTQAESDGAKIQSTHSFRPETKTAQ